MENHIKVARIHRLLALLYIIAGGAILAAIVIPGADGMEGVVVMATIYLLALFAVHYFTARGARQKKEGARIASMIIAFLMLFGFPIGTIIGIYLLVHTWSPWDKPAVEETA